MPLHHPLRLAEEIATLDVISGGRVEFGGGRGAFVLNYRGYGVDMIASRPLFAENLEFVTRAWTEERLTFRGEHFNVENIKVIPKPLQKPHPPIRLAANSVDTFIFAGEHGYPIFAGGPVNPIPVLGERLVIYKDALAKAGKKAPRGLAGRRADGAGRARSRLGARGHRAEPAALFQIGRGNHRTGRSVARAAGAIQNDAGSVALGPV